MQKLTKMYAFCAKMFKNVCALNENEHKMCTCCSHLVNRESYPVRGNSAMENTPDYDIRGQADFFSHKSAKTRRRISPRLTPLEVCTKGAVTTESDLFLTG